MPDPVSVALASETGEPLHESRKSPVSRPSTAREKVTGIEAALRPSVVRTSVPNDAVGAVPVDRPTEPPEVVATIFHSLGLNLESHLPGPAGRPFPLVDFGYREIKELF